LFHILDFLRYCDRRDMAKELGIMRYGFESLVEKDHNDWREID
jgi:hypothetical protein